MFDPLREKNERRRAVKMKRERGGTESIVLLQKKRGTDDEMQHGEREMRGARENCVFMTLVKRRERQRRSCTNYKHRKIKNEWRERAADMEKGCRRKIKGASSQSDQIEKSNWELRGSGRRRRRLFEEAGHAKDGAARQCDGRDESRTGEEGGGKGVAHTNITLPAPSVRNTHT